jgi:hypothetical protein
MRATAGGTRMILLRKMVSRVATALLDQHFVKDK